MRLVNWVFCQSLGGWSTVGGAGLSSMASISYYSIKKSSPYFYIFIISSKTRVITVATFDKAYASQAGALHPVYPLYSPCNQCACPWLRLGAPQALVSTG